MELVQISTHKKKELYTQIYREGQAILNKYNPCNISADGKTCNGKNNGFKPCCQGCEHLKEKGCGVSALYCKLWLCGDARRISPQCSRELQALMNKAVKLGIPLTYRGSKEESFAKKAPAMFYANY